MKLIMQFHFVCKVQLNLVILLHRVAHYPSGMSLREVLIFTDVSEDCTASISTS
jgi:hypothetical protein